MPKAILKTKESEADVAATVAALADEQVRRNCQGLIALMGAATHAPPKLWGPSIIGFGSATLKYASGRTLDWMPPHSLACLPAEGMVPPQALARPRMQLRGRACLTAVRRELQVSKNGSGRNALGSSRA